MMRYWILTLPLLCSACATVPANDAAICAGTAPAVAAHAGALAGLDPRRDPDVAAILTGDHLIRQIDAGCGR